MSSSPDTIFERFWARVARNSATTSAALGVFRWLYCLNLLLLDASSYSWLDDAPRALYAPPVLSLAYLFPSFPPAPFFKVLDTVGVLALCFTMVGYRTRIATVALLAVEIVGTNFKYCFGKIDHNGVEFALLLCMAVADWGRCHSADARFRPGAAAGANPLAAARGMSLLAVLLAFGMVTAGIEKAYVWIDFDLRTSGFLAWYYGVRITQGRALLLSDWVQHAPLPLLELGDYLAPLFECSGFVALLTSARAFRIWLATSALFHLSNVLFLNIPFNSQTFAYMAFVDYDTLLEKLRASRLGRGRWQLAVASVLVGLAGIWHIAARWTGNSSGTLLATDAATWYTVRIVAAVPIAVLAATALVLSSLRAGAAAATGTVQAP